MTEVADKIDRLIYTARMMSWIIDPRSYFTPPEMPIDRPVFLLGTQGGGLTLLSRMLQRHPDVVTAAGGASYWTAANELQNVYGPMLPFDLTGLRYKAPPHPELTAPRSWTFATGDLLPLYRRRQATPETAEALKRVIRLSALRHGKAGKTFRFVDKSQVFSVRAGMLHDIFPDARFILVPREPYVSVWRAAMGKAGDMRRLADKISYERRIEICAEHYGASMRAVLEDARDRGFDILLLPFEDLLQDPEGGLKRACDFTGLDFRLDMLPAAEHKMPVGSRFRDRWYPVRADVNDVYHDKIDALTIAAVNRYAGDVIERLGYKRR